MVTYAALSLNEFVDSMLVSNLLGSDAMAIVNLGMPLMLIISAVYFRSETAAQPSMPSPRAAATMIRRAGA